jgi:hypothetical protein
LFAFRAKKKSNAELPQRRPLAVGVSQGETLWDEDGI